MGVEHFGPRTYSQQGDDMVLACLFMQWGIHQPSYLDLGAHHPTRGSNTALFYERGSRGINVEANPELLAEFLRQRPEDVNLNCGVGAERGRMTLSLYGRDGCGTFRKAWAERVGQTADDGEIEIEIKTVDDILDGYNKGVMPDLLQIDIEGMDEEVLRSLDFAKRSPMVIDVEAFVGSPEAAGIRSALEAGGFFALMRCGHNAIFVRNDLRERMY